MVIHESLLTAIQLHDPGPFRDTDVLTAEGPKVAEAGVRAIHGVSYWTETFNPAGLAELMVSLSGV